MKKIIPILIAVVVFAVALAMVQPEEQGQVVIAARDMSARHVIQEGDVALRSLPLSSIPQDALRDLKAVIGQTLRVDRLAGDLILPAHLGGQQIELLPNERAIAIKVDDSGGLSGLIQPGDLVGVTAVLRSVNGTYSKYVAGGLRVLFITPEFRFSKPQSGASSEAEDSGVLVSPAMGGSARQAEGVVVLAVPVETQVLIYDFPLPDGTLLSEQRYINLIDLLPALDQAQDVALSLVLETRDAADFTSPGIFLPELALTPQPTPTPDLTATAMYTPGAEEAEIAVTPAPPPSEPPVQSVPPTPTPFGR